MAKPAEIPKIVPRRIDGTQGRRPPNYPDLNFRTIARAVGVASTFIGRIMNGRARASLKTATKLAAFLGWPLERVAGLYQNAELARKFPYRKPEAPVVPAAKPRPQEKPSGKPSKKRSKKIARRVQRTGGRGSG
jgi:DNA-binding XRE family transcriptional regulator